MHTCTRTAPTFPPCPATGAQSSLGFEHLPQQAPCTGTYSDPAGQLVTQVSTSVSTSAPPAGPRTHLAVLQVLTFHSSPISLRLPSESLQATLCNWGQHIPATLTSSITYLALVPVSDSSQPCRVHDGSGPRVLAPKETSRFIIIGSGASQVQDRQAPSVHFSSTTLVTILPAWSPSLIVYVHTSGGSMQV